MMLNDSFVSQPLAFRGGMMEEEHMLGWNIPPEHAGLVHPHWKQFLAPDLSSHFMLAAIYSMLMIMNTSGNFIVIYLFFTTKSLRTPSNVFVVNLAIFDLCMMLDMPMLIINSFYQRPIGWEFGCDMYGLFGSIAGIGSAINNAIIAYDRYRTIAFPLDGRLTYKQTLLLVLFAWAYALPFSISPINNYWGKYVPEGYLTTCSFDYLTQDENTRVFVGSIFVYSYCIPMFLIILFYSQLIGHVRQHEKMLKEQAKKMNVKSLSSNQDAAQKSVEIRIAKVALTIFFLFVCSWTPYALVALTGTFGDRSILTPMVGMIPAVFAKVVSCVDPWVYAINHPRFRAQLAKKFPMLGGSDDMVSDTVSVATEKTQASDSAPNA
ncbi:opsin-3-like [Macrosteles quadrilineatus]|uniref:opsin-3-like n=1 Tax=Macrosteles quadrilineatus TaxID=74068 RepID=UPI0023E26023|nr:opsin-3-like [Macrosteles quadrilineatus]